MPLLGGEEWLQLSRVGVLPVRFFLLFLLASFDLNCPEKKKKLNYSLFSFFFPSPPFPPSLPLSPISPFLSLPPFLSSSKESATLHGIHKTSSHFSLPVASDLPDSPEKPTRVSPTHSTAAAKPEQPIKLLIKLPQPLLHILMQLCIYT